MTAPRLSPDVIAVRVADETVTWNRVTGKLNLLDPVATQVVERLDGRSTAEVIADLCVAFNAPDARVRADVDALLSKLRQAGVLAPVVGT